MPSLIQHQKSTKHCLCPHCDPHESYEELLEARLPSIDKHSCPECEQSFTHQPSLEAHKRETLRGFCSNCNTLSTTKWLHTLHMRLHFPASATSAYSTTKLRCWDCNRDFKNKKALATHLLCNPRHNPKQGKNTQQANGKKRTKCKICKRRFKTHRALEQHLISVRHAQQTQSARSSTSIAHQHLERGQCVRNGMTRTKLNARHSRRIITSEDIIAQWAVRGQPVFISNSSFKRLTSQIDSSTPAPSLDPRFFGSCPTHTPTLPTDTHSTIPPR